jgi:hypothetical protein
MVQLSGRQRQRGRLGGTLNVLRGVQHFVADGTKRSWPSDDALPSEPDWSSDPPSGEEIRRRAEAYLAILPCPSAAIAGDEIRLWYGNPNDPN